MVPIPMVKALRILKISSSSIGRINLLFISINLLLSCQPLDEAKKTVPNSEATTFEQEEINQTVSEIETLATSMGIDRNFKNFPVIVILEDSLNRKAQAYCKHERNGAGFYVAIMKSTMDEYRLLYKPHGKNSFLFMLLVHEFGHCFFGRGHHENTALRNGGSKVPVSAMMTTSHNLLGMQELSQKVKSYYIAEIAGLNFVQDLPNQFMRRDQFFD